MKRLILLTVDGILLPVTLLLAFSLRYGTLFPDVPLERSASLFPLVTILGLGLIIVMGLHRIKLAAFENTAIIRTGIASLGVATIASGLSFGFGFFAPRSVPMIFGILFFVSSVGSRLMGIAVLEMLQKHRGKLKRVLIYGSGQAGIQLASALRQTREVAPIAFVDDNIALKGLIVSGLQVNHTSDVEEIIKSRKIDRVIIAMPSASEQKRREVAVRLSKVGCEVQTLPSFGELIDGKGLVESLKSVTADQLLGRDMVKLDLPEVAKTYKNKSVMVTGAGGSIGSELCRQLLQCGISKLVLFEHSEYALYALDQELAPIADELGVTLVTSLGSVTDAIRVGGSMRSENVQVVLHAAAYKHVPLVEGNELAGIHNNVFGTRVVADEANRAGLERFILVSTDKAVRPTNIMGASKRLSELVVQDLATRSKSTLYSMVRFGNVLGSSGSVIPLFQKQIAKGGPVTVTHSDVTRYFMTIPEAARLVLLAGSYARGGDVFVLDMGKPVKIIDLAKSIIEMSGLTVITPENPNGDIEINVTGLRPGEKLYEELLIGDEMLTTPHAKILRAQESQLSELEVANVLKSLRISIDQDNKNSAREVIEHWVEGYHQSNASVG
jgi:FlaA1/EpsC-like NDP-sugar epimerase